MQTELSEFSPHFVRISTCPLRAYTKHYLAIPPVIGEAVGSNVTKSPARETKYYNKENYVIRQNFLTEQSGSVWYNMVCAYLRFHYEKLERVPNNWPILLFCHPSAGMPSLPSIPKGWSYTHNRGLQCAIWLLLWAERQNTAVCFIMRGWKWEKNKYLHDFCTQQRSILFPGHQYGYKSGLLTFMQTWFQEHKAELAGTVHISLVHQWWL